MTEMEDRIDRIRQANIMHKGSTHRHLLSAQTAILYISDEDEELRKCEKLIAEAIDIIAGDTLPEVKASELCERCGAKFSLQELCTVCRKEVAQLIMMAKKTEYDETNHIGIYS